jgi:SAM-dependent methyltransferase
LSPDYTRRFSQRADFYAKYRPGYPAKVLAILERSIGFDVGHIVADIGSGTGLLTRLFLQNGNTVFSVEPNDKMRAYAERDLAGFGNFRSVNGTAEHTTLPKGSVDLITIGQALHWFDPVKTTREFSRISKPDARLCVVYNGRNLSNSFMRAYEATVERNTRERAKVPDPDIKYIASFFKGGRCSKFTIPNEQILDLEGLMGRLLSGSYMPVPSKGAKFKRFEKDVRDLFDAYNTEGHVRLLYDTEISIGRARTQ